MANFKEVEVTKPFHLTVKEYKKLFPEFKARGNNILVVAIDPIPELSGLDVQAQAQKKETQMKKLEETFQALAHKGFMVIDVGDEPKGIKIGDLVLTSSQHTVEYAVKRKILVKDVFPRIRTYAMMTIPEHAFPITIHTDPTVLVHVMASANLDAEERNFEEYKADIIKRENDVNL